MHVSPHHGLRLLINLASIDLDWFLVRSLPILFGVDHTLVFASSANFPEYYLWELHLLIMKPGPIWYQNLGYRRLVERY